MSGERLLLDTNVIIGFLKGEKQIVRFLGNRLKKDAVLFVSQIKRMEMLSYHGLSKEDEAGIKEFLADVQVFMLEPRVEARAVVIRREHRLKLPDAVIVATALVNNCILVTCDLDLGTKRIAGCCVEIPKIPDGEKA